jgi:hypothetical protein
MLLRFVAASSVLEIRLSDAVSGQQESDMAKGEQKSNREAKKPKATKKPAPAAAASSNSGKTGKK